MALLALAYSHSLYRFVLSVGRSLSSPKFAKKIATVKVPSKATARECLLALAAKTDVSTTVVDAAFPPN
jgi:predicted permease